MPILYPGKGIKKQTLIKNRGILTHVTIHLWFNSSTCKLLDFSY